MCFVRCFHREAIGFANAGDFRGELHHNACGGAFRQQHGHDLRGRAITEKLAQGFFMPGDVVLGHEGQKIRWRIAAQGAAAEMRIFGEEVLR